MTMQRVPSVLTSFTSTTTTSAPTVSTLLPTVLTAILTLVTVQSVRQGTMLTELSVQTVLWQSLTAKIAQMQQHARGVTTATTKTDQFVARVVKQWITVWTVTVQLTVQRQRTGTTQQIKDRLKTAARQ